MRNPYDLIVEEFSAERQSFREKKYVDELLERLEPRASVLDLGCGNGRPIGEYMVQRGCRITGIDRSEKMLAAARKVIPQAGLVRAEIESLELRGQYAAIVMWDSLFHVERRHHKPIFAKLRRWLTNGGTLLMSSGGTASKGFTSRMHGYRFFYSAYSPKNAVKFLEEAGFTILLCEIDDPSSKGHIAVLAQAKPRRGEEPPPWLPARELVN